jgi:transcription elongation factor Elf1
MEIIKNNYQPKEYIKNCPKCNSTLKFTDNDIHHDRDGNYIVCLCCGRFIDTSIWEDHIWDEDMK